MGLRAEQADASSFPIRILHVLRSCSQVQGKCSTIAATSKRMGTECEDMIGRRSRGGGRVGRRGRRRTGGNKRSGDGKVYAQELYISIRRRVYGRVGGVIVHAQRWRSSFSVYMTVPSVRSAFEVCKQVVSSASASCSSKELGRLTCSSASMSPMRSRPAALAAAPDGGDSPVPFGGVAAAAPAAPAGTTVPSALRTTRRRRRRRGRVMNLGSGRASRSSETFVAACRACRERKDVSIWY